MSTIATPRDPIPRRTASSSAALTANTTPSSSARPSLDIPPSSATTSPIPSNPAKRNRAALREYYNLRSQQQSQQQQLQTPLIIPPTITTSPPPPSSPSFSSSPPQPIDLPSFNPQTFINQSLETSSLSDLLRLYTRVLSEIRALDAEKKALVYDNYSKLITATETIRKMRTTMDPLNPMAGTLDLVVERVYKLAEGLRGDMRKELAEKPKLREEGEEAAQKKKKEDTRRLAREAIKVPGRLRKLVEEGREEEARKEWELPRRLLVSWKEKGLGGDDVQRLIEEGDRILESGTGSVGDRSEVGSENRGEV